MGTCRQTRWTCSVEPIRTAEKHSSLGTSSSWFPRQGVSTQRISGALSPTGSLRRTMQRRRRQQTRTRRAAPSAPRARPETCGISGASWTQSAAPSSSTNWRRSPANCSWRTGRPPRKSGARTRPAKHCARSTTARSLRRVKSANGWPMQILSEWFSAPSLESSISASALASSVGGSAASSRSGTDTAPIPGAGYPLTGARSTTSPSTPLAVRPPRTTAASFCPFHNQQRPGRYQQPGREPPDDPEDT